MERTWLWACHSFSLNVWVPSLCALSASPAEGERLEVGRPLEVLQQLVSSRDVTDWAPEMQGTQLVAGRGQWYWSPPICLCDEAGKWGTVLCNTQHRLLWCSLCFAFPLEPVLCLTEMRSLRANGDFLSTPFQGRDGASVSAVASSERGGWVTLSWVREGVVSCVSWHLPFPTAGPFLLPCLIWWYCPPLHARRGAHMHVHTPRTDAHTLSLTCTHSCEKESWKKCHVHLPCQW